MKKQPLAFKNPSQTTNRNKLTNNSALGQHSNPNFSPASIQLHSLTKNHENQKSQTIQRNCSEDDFKKYIQAKGKVSTGKRQEQFMYANSSKSSKKMRKSPRFYHKSPNGPIERQGKEKLAQLPLNLNLKKSELKETACTTAVVENKRQFGQPPPRFLRNRTARLSNLEINSDLSENGTPILLGRENFKIINKLGQGKFGKVFLVKEVHTGMVLAMKMIEKKRIIKDNLLEQFIRELKIQTYLNHPYIISLYGFFDDSTHFYTLLELGCDNQLYSLMTGGKKLLEEQTTSFIIKSLLEAISEMHSHRILHRDIKPQNIVLIMGNVKICDFGWAVNKAHSGELRSTYCGTPLYLSPQILQGYQYDEKVDLWAIGILAYELMLNTTPFQIQDQYDLQKIITDEIVFPNDERVSEEFKEFIRAILAKDPKKRMCSEQLLTLNFITKYSDFETCEELCN